MSDQVHNPGQQRQVCRTNLVLPKQLKGCSKHSNPLGSLAFGFAGLRTREHYSCQVRLGYMEGHVTVLKLNGFSRDGTHKPSARLNSEHKTHFANTYTVQCHSSPNELFGKFSDPTGPFMALYVTRLSRVAGSVLKPKKCETAVILFTVRHK